MAMPNASGIFTVLMLGTPKVATLCRWSGSAWVSYSWYVYGSDSSDILGTYSEPDPIQGSPITDDGFYPSPHILEGINKPSWDNWTMWDGEEWD